MIQFEVGWFYIINVKWGNWRAGQYKDTKVAVEATDTVELLKCKMRAYTDRSTVPEGIPPSLQRMTFKGRSLEDRRTLGSYNIVSGSDVYMSWDQAELQVYVNEGWAD